MPHWSSEQVAPLGGAGYVLSLIAGKGATVEGRCRLLADAQVDGADGIGAVSAVYEARLRPWAEAAQRTERRNVHLFTPASRFQLVARKAVLRLAALPFLAPLVKRLLNREGERLGSS